MIFILDPRPYWEAQRTCIKKCSTMDGLQEPKMRTNIIIIGI